MCMYNIKDFRLCPHTHAPTPHPHTHFPAVSLPLPTSMQTLTACYENKRKENAYVQNYDTKDFRLLSETARSAYAGFYR